MSTRSSAGQPDPVISAYRSANPSGRPKSGDRRQRQRFPLACQIRYRTLSRTQPMIEGAGRTVNVSSRGILFTTEQALQPGEQVRIAVAWPAGNGRRLTAELAAVAKVVRSEERLAAIELLRAELRRKSS